MPSMKYRLSEGSIPKDRYLEWPGRRILVVVKRSAAGHRGTSGNVRIRAVVGGGWLREQLEKKLHERVVF